METFNILGQNISSAIANPLEFVSLHPVISIIALLWLLFWKGVALWKSARRNSVFWFVILLVLNTLSIGEMAYYLWTKSKDKKELQ